MRLTLTTDYQKTDESAGILQNVSNDAVIEVTDNVNEQGLLLRPYAVINVEGAVYAHKYSGNGTAILAFLPFKEASSSGGENDSGTNAGGEKSDDYYNDLTPPKTAKYEYPAPPPPPPPLKMPPRPRPKRPWEHPKDDVITLEIPRSEVEAGKTKFFVDLSK